MGNTLKVAGRGAIVGQAGQQIVYPGETIAADVVWLNSGLAFIAPVFRLDIRESGLFVGWQEGPWITSPGAAPGAQATVTPFRPVPSNWRTGITIDVKLMVQGIEGSVWEESDIFLIGEPLGEVEIISVEPYVER
ncbi:hypothetical protein LCGC14_2316530 [marine sediment metagenome]|uniref:Uncharacterized protein n=1 Tax=marine sediment metagenome TaxID=412755 RepID=A0A0F9D6M1_9ZZZZ